MTLDCLPHPMNPEKQRTFSHGDEGSLTAAWKTRRVVMNGGMPMASRRDEKARKWILP